MMSKKYDSQLRQLAEITKNLMERFVTKKIRDDHWKGYAEFKKKREGSSELFKKLRNKRTSSPSIPPLKLRTAVS